MALTENTTGGQSIKIHRDVHREIKIAAAYRNEEIQDLVRRAWELFKKTEGKKLHQGPEDRPSAA